MKKTRKIRLLAFILTLCMMLGALPLYVLADEGEEIPEDLQDRIVEEIPFEPEYLPGDLTFAECRTATLNLADVPAVISPAQIEKYQHVNRLYEQEPDLYTIIFQNRDGSKTVYVFEKPVKSNEGNGVVMDMSASAIANAYKPSFPSQNTMTQNALSQNVASILAMQERLDAYKAANDLKEYQMLDDVLEATTVNASSASALLLNNSVSVASVSTTYSPLSGEYAFKGANKYLTCLDGELSMLSYLTAPHGKWALVYSGANTYHLRSRSCQWLYLSKSNDELILSETPKMWTLTAYDSENYLLMCEGEYLNSNLTFSSSDMLWIFTNHVIYVDIESISINLQVLNVNVGGTVSTPEITVYPEDAMYADTDSDFNWHSTNTSVLGCGDLYYEGNSAGIVQIYCQYRYDSSLESNRVTVIVSETPPAGEAITSGAVYLIRPYAETIDLSTKLLTMNVASSGNTLSLSNWGTQYTSVEGTYYKWGNLSQGFTITQIGTANLYRISAILSTDQYNGGLTFINKYTVPNTLYAASSNSLGLKRADSGRTDETPNNDDLTQLWKMYYVNGGWVFVNAAYPQSVLKYNSASVSLVNTSNITNIKWSVSFMGVDVPAIRQSKNYYCAAASTLQALFARNIYLSTDNNYNLSSWAAAQNTIWASFSKVNSTTPNDGAIRTYLVSQLGTSSYMMKYRASFSGKADLLIRIQGNLKSGYVPVVRASGDRIENLPYCGQSYPYSSGHYITVIGYDSFTDQVIVSDCNWNANYYGIFAFSAQKLYDALADLTYYGYYQ